jgi:hypothetical protein
LAFIRLIIPLLMLALFNVAAVAAQERSCGQTVENALWSIRQHCADLARNSLCYSHPQVDLTFADDATMDDFSLPPQRASLVSLSSIRSSALDLERAHWGLAVLNLGANIPQTYLGPGIIVMLAGDAIAINEIDPADVMNIDEPLSTAALAKTTRYKKPGIIPEPVGTVAAEEILLVDAFDDMGDWLRVVTDGSVSWVEGEDVARLNAMETLPMIGIGATFPFQALSISTGIEYPKCDQAEPMVAIQTPEDMPVNLTVNGVDIHISAMVTFQQVHRNALSLTVHRGEVTTIFGQTVKQGETVLGILGKTAKRDFEVLDWSGALPASETELARGQRAQDALNDLARVNGWAPYKTFSHPPDLVHVVERGESLYSIGRRYETSVAEIILANLGDEPLKLYSGATLIIPNPGSGFAGHGSVPLDATLEE